MRYMASIYVSDVMDLVAASVEVQGWSEQYGPPDIVGTHTFTWAGIGQDDAAEWLRRALLLLSQAMTTPPPEGTGEGAAMGGRYTISETGDIAD